MFLIRSIKFFFILLSVALLAGCLAVTDPLSQDHGSLYYRTTGNTNLWILLGKDLHLDHHSEQKAVQQKIDWYMHHRLYLEDIAKHATPYVYYVLQQVKKHNMPSEVALVPIIESNYDPFAYSDDGAAGLWQMMPGTASGYKITQNWWYDGRRDIYASTQAALGYLEYLHNFFNGDWLLAFAAYNSGEGTVQNAIRANKRKGLPTDFWHLKLPAQTRSYVPKLLAVAAILSNPDQYPIKWPTTEVAPFLASVQIDSQIDLAVAAKLAGISTQELYQLNPGFSRWATDPDGKHMLLLPADKVSEFEQNLQKLPNSKRVTWKRYTVKSGDSLITIAHRFETTPSLIKQVNGLSDNTILPKQVLLIPRQKQSFAKAVMAAVKHYIHNERALPGPNRIVHIIQPGDSLWKMAKDYNLKERDIRFWNHLEKGKPLIPGTELVLWSQKGPRAYRAAKLRPYIIEHTVVSGDNLRDLAKEYHVSIEAIQKANNLTSNTIQLGKILVIPPTVRKLSYGSRLRPNTYTVKAGDSLSTIAHRFGMSSQVLKNANKLNSSTIRIGQVLNIPKVK